VVAGRSAGGAAGEAARLTVARFVTDARFVAAGLVAAGLEAARFRIGFFAMAGTDGAVATRFGPGCFRAFTGAVGLTATVGRGVDTGAECFAGPVTRPRDDGPFGDGGGGGTSRRFAAVCLPATGPIPPLRVQSRRFRRPEEYPKARRKSTPGRGKQMVRRQL
jgi:hypothetical protein